MDSNQSVSLSPTQATPLPSSATGISSFPIRAPLSSDSDFESALKAHSRSSSDSSVLSAKSFESEEGEGFLSGEDGFETASEKEALENLDLTMEGDGNGDGIVIPLVAKPGLGSSSFSSTTPPKARISFEEDDDVDDIDEVLDDGDSVVQIPIDGGIVEAPKVGVLDVEEEEKGMDDISGDSGIVVNGLVSENPVLGLSTVELVDDKVPGVVDAFDEPLAVSKEDVVPENSDLGSSENGGLDSEVKGPFLEENPVLDSGSSELAAADVHASVEAPKEAPVVSEKDIPVVANDSALDDVEVSKEASVASKEDIPVVVNDSVPDAVEVSKEALLGSKEDIPALVNGSVPDVVEVSKEAPLFSEEEFPPLTNDSVHKVVEVSKQALVESKEDIPVAVADIVAVDDEVSKEAIVASTEDIPATVPDSGPIVNAVPEEALVASEEDIPVLAADSVPVDVEVANESVVAHTEYIPAIVTDPIVSEVSKEALDASKEDIPLPVTDNVPVVNEVTAEALVPSEEDISVLDSGSSETAGESVPRASEVSNDALVVSSEDILPESPNLGEMNSEIGEVEVKDVVQEEKNVELGSKQGELLNENDSDKEVKLKSEEDLLVETKPTQVELESGDVDVEENHTSEANPPSVEGGSFANGDVVSSQSPAVIEEPEADMESTEADYENGELSASEKNLEAAERSAIESEEVEDQVAKIETVEVQKDDDENVSSSVANTLSLDADDTSDKPELESKLNEPTVSLAVDGGENKSGDALDGFGEAQRANSGTTPEEVNPVQEENVPGITTQNRDAGVASEGDGLEVVSKSYQAPETAVPTSTFVPEVKDEAEDVDHVSEYEEAEDSVTDEDTEELNFGSSGTAEEIIKELMRGTGVSFPSGAGSSQDSLQRIDGQITMDSDEEVDTDEEGEGKELFDSAALAALLKAATGGGQEGGNITLTSQDGSRLFSVERPAGLGTSLRPKPASQPSRPNIFRSSELMVGGEVESTLTEEEKKKLEKIQAVRVKYLRLLHKLGHSSDDDPIAAQVLYRMVLAAGRQTGPAFSLETAKKTAMQLETENSDDLDFSLNILVLGKTGVGKSATINSIFGEEKAKIGAFEPATTKVKEITGTVGGVKIRVLDTPGLSSSVMEQSYNRSILSSAKKWIKKFPVDILLYVDRLDTQTRDLNDLPLLKTITNSLGSSIWKSAVVTLTHAASAPPDGPMGAPLSYDVFVAQRSHIVQQSIGQAVGDLRMMNPSLMNPVTLAENHPSCRKNREGQRILPNGQVWRPQLLLLCYSLKVLSEVSSLSKPQDAFDHRKLFGFRVRAPPLPYLLSSLLQSRAHPKLPDDQGGDNVDSDIDLEDLSDSDQEEEEDEYDQLPPFKPLRKAQIAKLSNDQRKAYFDEYDYRVKLLQKKQWKEELKRMKEMKKRGKDQKGNVNVDEMGEEADQEGPAAVPVALPDMVLPPSFDSDNPAYRYRFLEPTSQLLARPVLDTHGWDHDCGYDGVSLEENHAIAGKFPGGVAVQITKDKKEFNIHLDSSIAAKHGENVSTLAGFDIQTIGKQLGYIVRGETKFKNFKKNKTTGGVSVTFLGENIATGVKIEDQIRIGKRLTLVGSTGTTRSQGDAAYGANLEVCLKEKDFPIGQDQSTLGLSLMKWRGDLALGANLQSQVSIGRSSKMSIRVGLNNKLSGQITIRTSSSEQLQLALVGVLPIAISIYRSIWPSTGESYSAY